MDCLMLLMQRKQTFQHKLISSKLSQYLRTWVRSTTHRSKSNKKKQNLTKTKQSLVCAELECTADWWLCKDWISLVHLHGKYVLSVHNNSDMAILFGRWWAEMYSIAQKMKGPYNPPRLLDHQRRFRSSRGPFCQVKQRPTWRRSPYWLNHCLMVQ